MAIITLDLQDFLSTMNLLGRNGQLTIYGPEGLEDILKSQLKIGDSKFAFDIKFKTLFGKEREIIFEDKKWRFILFHLNTNCNQWVFNQRKRTLRKLKKRSNRKRQHCY